MLWLKLPDANERKILVKNLLDGKKLDGSIDDLISNLVQRTDGYSQRMIVDVVNRTTPVTVDSRLQGKVPTDRDFRGQTETITEQSLDEACAYAEELYQFKELRENAKAIKDFFDKLGKGSQTIGFAHIVSNGSRNGSKSKAALSASQVETKAN